MNYIKSNHVVPSFPKINYLDICRLKERLWKNTLYSLEPGKMFSL